MPFKQRQQIALQAFSMKERGLIKKTVAFGRVATRVPPPVFRV
jgi:hypothetical protein